MNEQDRVRLDRIEDTLRKVYDAITGNELDGNRGIVYRLEKVEETSHKIEREFDRVKWAVIAWGAGAGIIGSGASSLISRLLGN